MKVVKIYSGITTADEQIKDAITSRSKIWNKASTTFIKPYESILKNNLGEFPNVQTSQPLDFTVKRTEFLPKVVENILAM